MIKIRRKLGITIIKVLLVSISILFLTPLACTSGGEIIDLPPSQSASGLAERLTLDDLAARANLVVLGEVVDIVYQKEADGSIYTLATLSVEQTFKGETIKEVVISTPGGKLDGEILEVEGAPKLQLGESAIVFLEKGDGIFRVIGGFQGKFTIDENNMVGNVPLPQFVEQVRNAVAKQ